MLNLRDRNLYPRYRVKATAGGTLNRTATVPVLSTVFEFNTMHTSITTDQDWLSTHMTGDTEIGTNSECHLFGVNKNILIELSRRYRSCVTDK